MKFKKFISECRENGVLKNLSIYIVSSWVLLQVVALIAEPLGFPKSIVAYLLLALLIGFPLYVYSVWRFQLAETIEKLPKVDKTGNPIPGKFIRSPFQKMYFTFLTFVSIIALGVTLVVAKKNIVEGSPVLAIKTSDKIAVLKFDNNTGDEKYDIAGKMAVDWIIHGITQNKVGQVISPEIVDDYSDILKASMFPTGEDNFVMDYLKPSKIIEGEFYLRRNRLLFQCSIRDEIMDKTFYSFKPVECDPSSPLDCIEALTKRILGYLVTENIGLNSLQGTPPSFEAYQNLTKAKNQGNSGNDTEYLRLLDMAISADSTYFEPKLYKFTYYYNKEQYQVADSLLKKLTVKSFFDERQQNFINLYKALLEGNFRRAYKYQQKEYNLTPFHLETNSTMMTFSLQLINKPQAVDSIYRAIDMKEGMLQNCAICAERYKIMALSNIELGEYLEAIALLDDFSNLKGYAMLKKVLLRAYIKSANYDAAQKLLNTVVLTNSQEWMDIFLFAAKEFLIVDNPQLANKYLDKIVDGITSAENMNTLERKEVLAETLFFREKYVRAEKILEELGKDGPLSISRTALLAIAYHKNGKLSKAANQIKILEGLKTKYQYGSISYALAQYYAAMSDDKTAMGYLTKAVAEGHWYETSSFQNDPFFKTYIQTDGFKRVLSFWH